MVKSTWERFFGERSNLYDNVSIFGRILRDWDRIATLTCLMLYAIWSLTFGPIPVLLNAGLPNIAVRLLFYELIFGCSAVIIGIITRYYRPQWFGALVVLSAVGLQVIIGIIADGLTTGDYLVAALFFCIIALIRRVRSKRVTTNEILHIHYLVDEAAKGLNKGINPDEDEPSE